MKKDKKLSPTLSGIAGEYFVAAELSKLGYIASLTLKNTRGVDILASNSDSSKTVAIQVKTNQNKNKVWVLSEKAENFSSSTHFYVFVNLSTQKGYPDFHIVPSKEVASWVKKNHSNWLKKPGKNGKPHQDNPIRQFRDRESKYLNRWELLGLG